jgi:serine/threonine protein kinase
MVYKIMYKGRKRKIHKGKRGGSYIIINKKKLYLKKKLKRNKKSIGMKKTKLKLFGGVLGNTNVAATAATAPAENVVAAPAENVVAAPAENVVAPAENVSFREYYWFWSIIPQEKAIEMNNTSWEKIIDDHQGGLCDAYAQKNPAMSITSITSLEESDTFDFSESRTEVNHNTDVIIVFCNTADKHICLKGVKTTHKLLLEIAGEKYREIISPKSWPGMESRLQLPHSAKIDKLFRKSSPDNVCCECNGTKSSIRRSFHCSYCGIWVCSQCAGTGTWGTSPMFYKADFRIIHNGKQSGYICKPPSKLKTHKYMQLCDNLLNAVMPICFPKPKIWFTERNFIEKGGMGKVYNIDTNDTNIDPSVVKIINLSDLRSSTDIINELKTLVMFKDVDHPNLVKFYQVYVEKETKTLGILQEKLNLNLRQVIKQMILKTMEMNDRQKKCILYQVAQGLKFFHKVSIVWRDLKPENIMLDVVEDSKLQVKLVDFDLCFFNKKADFSENSSRLICGTYHYMAPEIYEQKQYKREIDLWAFGCLCFELYTLKLLFNNKTIPGLITKIRGYVTDDKQAAQINTMISNELESGKVEETSALIPQLKDLIKRCIWADSQYRATILTVLEHGFFNNVNTGETLYLPVDYLTKLNNIETTYGNGLNRNNENLKALRLKYVNAETDLDEIIRALAYTGGKSLSKKQTSKKQTSKKQTSKKQTSKKQTSKKQTSKKKTSKKQTSKKQTSKKKTSKKKTSKKQTSKKQTSKKQTSKKQTSKKQTSKEIISDRKRVIHTGSRGGKYYIRNKRKVYIRN